MARDSNRRVATPLDLNSLLVRLRLRLGSDIDQLRPMLQGASSHTLQATLATRSGATSNLVVKVAPPGLPPVGNRDVLRQAAMLKLLGTSGIVPVPDVVVEDEGEPPDVPPYFVMTYVPGQAFEPLFDAIDPDHPATASEVGGRAHAAATVLSRLHAVSTAHQSLQDEPVLSLEQEVQRWAAALASVTEPAIPDWERCRDELLGSAPCPAGAVISHGDFRLGNMIADGSAIMAVIDWEIWALADPRVDLAWLRLNSDPTAYRRVSPFVEAMPAPDELCDSYARSAGIDVADIHWFDAAARFKAAAIWALILKRAKRVGDDRFNDVEHVLAGLIDTSRALLR